MQVFKMCGFILLFSIICIPIAYCFLMNNNNFEYYLNYVLEIVALILEGASSFCDIAISQLLQVIIISKLLEIILSALWIIALCIYYTVVSCHQRICKNTNVPKQQDFDAFTISHFLSNQINDDSIKIIERNKEEIESKITMPVVFSKSTSDLTLNELRGYSDEKLNEERPNANDKPQVSCEDVLITLQTSTDSTKSERQAIHDMDINNTCNTNIQLTALPNGHPHSQSVSAYVSMSSLCTDIFSSALDIDNAVKESVTTCVAESIESLTSCMQLNNINIKILVNDADISNDPPRVIRSTRNPLRVNHSTRDVDPPINLAYQSYNQIFIVNKPDATANNPLRMSFRKRVRHRLNRFFTHLNCVKPNVEN